LLNSTHPNLTCPVQEAPRWSFRKEFLRFERERTLCLPGHGRSHIVYAKNSTKNHSFIEDEMDPLNSSCIVPVPEGYVYPVDWPQRMSTPVNFANFGLNETGCPHGLMWCDYLTEDYLEKQKRLEKQFLRYLPLCSGRLRNVLDVGGGAGAIALNLVNYGSLVLTMNGRFHKYTKDPYVPFQEFIAEKSAGLHITHDAVEIPYPFASRSFDMLTNKAFLTFIPPEEWFKMMLEWNRILRPGAFVVFFHNFEGGIKRSVAKLREVTDRLWWSPVAVESGMVIFVTPTTNKAPTKH